MYATTSFNIEERKTYFRTDLQDQIYIFAVYLTILSVTVTIENASNIHWHKIYIVYISQKMSSKPGPSAGNKNKDTWLVLHAEGEIFKIKFKIFYFENSYADFQF